MELRAGDRIRWTRNDADLGLFNGQTAEVTAVADGRVSSRLEDGRMPDRWSRERAVAASAAVEGASLQLRLCFSLRRQPPGFGFFRPKPASTSGRAVRYRDGNPPSLRA